VSRAGRFVYSEQYQKKVLDKLSFLDLPTLDSEVKACSSPHILAFRKSQTREVLQPLWLWSASKRMYPPRYYTALVSHLR
jgi:hypothetical protein